MSVVSSHQLSVVVVVARVNLLLESGKSREYFSAFSVMSCICWRFGSGKLIYYLEEIMEVGDYVKVVDARGILSKNMGDIVKVTERHSFCNEIKVEGSNLFWRVRRFEPLPTLTEVPPKGSKVIKVEKSCNGSLDSDGSLGKVFTTTGGGGYILHLCGNETGGIIRSDITRGKWALVSLPETEEIAQYEKGEYLKVVKNLFGLVVGELVQYVGEAKDNGIEIRCKGVSRNVFKAVSKDCVEKLPILAEPVPIGSQVVKIKEEGNCIFDKYIGEIITTCKSTSGNLGNKQWVKEPNGQAYWISDTELDHWALVEAAKVETEFQVGDRVIAKEDLVTVETREFQGECLNIDQLLAKCHTLAAKKSFISKIFKKEYWV